MIARAAKTHFNPMKSSLKTIVLAILRYKPRNQSVNQPDVLFQGSIKYNYLDHCPRQRRDNAPQPN